MNPRSSPVNKCARCRGSVVVARTPADRVIVLESRPKTAGGWFEDLRKSCGPVVVRRLAKGERWTVYSRFWAEHRCDR